MNELNFVRWMSFFVKDFERIIQTDNMKIYSVIRLTVVKTKSGRQ